MRRYTFDQIEALFYMSRKNHFRDLERHLDWESKAIAGRLGEIMAKVFS